MSMELLGNEFIENFTRTGGEARAARSPGGHV